MDKRPRILVLLALLLTVPETGCGSPRIRERAFRAHPVARAGGRGLIPGSGGAASPEAAAYARSAAELEASGDPSPLHSLALADMADDLGSRLLVRDQAAALPWFRDAAAHASFVLASSNEHDLSGPIQTRAVALHNHAVEELLRCAGTGPRKVNPSWREQLAALDVTIASTNPTTTGLIRDEIWVAADYKVANLSRVEWPGLGVPVVTLSQFPDREAVPDKFLPPRLRLAATAVLHPNGQIQGGSWRTQPLTLTLHDPMRETSVSLASDAASIGLAGDLTTPIAHQFIMSRSTELAWGGLFRPDNYAATSSIFMRGPYQPGKIPVLFVHGLFSSPDAWLYMSNELLADPLIRDRYQFWYAYYPTGSPIPFSAARVRRKLHELREAIDPGHEDPALDRMVVVGHSLGGVLSKQMIQTSGRNLERALFTRPLDQISMADETRDKVSHLLFFEPEPSIARVVFICAPHRGSNTATRAIGRLGSSLIRGEGDSQAMRDEVVALNGPDVLQPEFRGRAPNSIDNLSFDSPVLRALAALPISPAVPYHSIVAMIIPQPTPEHTTDGVVSYESSHLDGAESELMIRYSHFANGTHDASVEVQRILRLHLEAPPR